MRKNFWRRLGAAAALSCALLAPMPRALAGAGVFEAAAGAITSYFSYQSTLAQMLALGSDARYQYQAYWQDKKEGGTDENPVDTAAVSRVMGRLTQPGLYVIPVDGLPFAWHVTDRSEFNAACYPMNYITINRGLVRVLGGNEAEMAAVLGHEMTHGLAHHSAEAYAATVATYNALSFLNMATGAMDWSQLTRLTVFASAKYFTLPREVEADAGGFRIAARAGYNPGGGAAAMARMQAYFAQESQDFREYTDPNEKTNGIDYNDHPETLDRETALLKLLTDYSAGHVTVTGRKDVCIDGQVLCEGPFTAEDYDDTAENADLLAGELARLFHDESTADGWGTQADGSFEDARAPRLTELIRRQGLSERLASLVRAAYAGEAGSGARAALLAREQAETAQLLREAQAVKSADQKAQDRMRMNSDVYSDYGNTALAVKMIDRAMAATPQGSAEEQQKAHAENLCLKGRALAVSGDFAGGLALADEACAADAKNVYNFLNRADIRWMQGDLPAALADCALAVKADAKNPYGYLMQGLLYDEAGDAAQALAAYRTLYEKDHGFAARIPDEYLKDIDAGALGKLQKARAKAAKTHVEEMRKADTEKKENPVSKQEKTEEKSK